MNSGVLMLTRWSVAVLSWMHAGMGAMQVRKHELGGLNMGKIAEQRMLSFLEANLQTSNMAHTNLCVQ